jgi:nucleoside-diphosphate-sugar epimerase
MTFSKLKVSLFMKILIIGGTRFSGPHTVAMLTKAGHDVLLLHRGQHESPLIENAQHIHGDLHQLEQFLPRIKAFGPDIALHMMAYTRDDAENFMRCMRGIVRRVVVPSSQDVYRVYGRLHRTEPGPPDPVPLTEDSPLREKLSIHAEGYEKRWVEEVVMNDDEIAGTILRYPAIYGPGDHRLYIFTRRLFDQRPVILLEENYSKWRWTFAYCEDIAHATMLALINERAAGRIYNVGENNSPTMIDRVRRIATIGDWKGKIVAVSNDQMPAYLREDLDWKQNWITDSTRIRTELGYAEITNYDEGIRRTLQWQRENPIPLKPEQFGYSADDAVIASLKL